MYMCPKAYIMIKFISSLFQGKKVCLTVETILHFLRLVYTQRSQQQILTNEYLHRYSFVSISKTVIVQVSVTFSQVESM